MFRRSYHIVFCLIILLQANLSFAQSSPADMNNWFRNFKQTATPAELYRFLHAMPKGGDLHHHLTGAAFSEWWWELATDTKRNGGYEYFTRTRLTLCDGFDANAFSPASPYLLFKTIQASTFASLSECEKKGYTPLAALTASQKEAFLDSLRLDKEGEGRDEFFQTHWQRLNDLTRNPVLISELLLLNMEAYAREKVQYLETQAGVHGMLNPDGTGYSAEEALAIMQAALSSERAVKTGVTVKFQYALLRFLPDAEDTLKSLYAFVDAHRDIYRGINLVGREDNDKGYPLRFLSTFRSLRQQYPVIPLSIHAGEVDEPNRHVRDTLLLGADRIGHGLNTITDPDTLLLMRHGPYLIEINLISNLLLEYVSQYSEHPFAEYLRTGIPVALSTDDRGMWDSTLTDEFYVAVSQFNLSWQELRVLVNNSVQFSFLTDEEKTPLLSRLNQHLDAFEKKVISQQALPGYAAPRQFICKFEPQICTSPQGEDSVSKP